MAKTNRADSKAADNLERLFAQVRTSIDPTVPTQLVHAFIAVARNEGSTLTDLAERLGANISTASRHLLDLGERNRKKEPGYDLVESRTDPTSLRSKNYTLTPKGKLLWGTLLDIMES